MNIFLVATKDYNFYNFRRKFIITLVKLGHNVTLISPYGEKIDYFKERGCNFIDVSVDRRGTNILTDLKLIITYIRIFRKLKPDLVLTYTTKCSVYPGIACRLLKIKYIVNNAGLIKTKGVLKLILDFLYKFGYGKASCMMYQNREERDYLNKILHNKVPYRELPGSGVDLDEFTMTQYPKSDDKIIFNYVGRIVKIKGIYEYLECAKFIKKKYSNTEFRIFGDFDDINYKKEIEKLESQHIIKYCGIQKDMKPFIRQCHVVIHPSHYEGMTNVVLEHSAMGRICIGSDISGVREGISDGETGFLFKVGDIKSLIATVEVFLSKTYQEKENMGKLARIKMEKEFDRTIVKNIYLDEINLIGHI